MLGGRHAAGVIAGRLRVWGWFVPVAVGGMFLGVAWSETHGQHAHVGGRVVVNQAQAAARAGQDALARGASDEFGNPLACYFSAPGGHDYLSCGPVYVDASSVGWDNFNVTTSASGSGVRVDPVDGVVEVGPLPVGTRLVSGGGVVSTVGVDQHPRGRMGDTGAWTAAKDSVLVGLLWAFVSLLTVGSRRNRRRAGVAAEVEAGRRDAIWRSWEVIGRLPSAGPIQSPSPVFCDPGPRPAAQFGWAVDESTGEILEPAGTSSSTGPATTGPGIGSEGVVSSAVADQQLALPVAALVDEASPPPMSGPGVLLLGAPMLVGAAADPDRKVVVELAAYLVCHRNGPRSSEQIQAALWPLSGSRRDATLDTVRQQLSRLRRCVGEEHLPDAAKSGGYRFDDAVFCDWLRFQALAEAARRSEGTRSLALRREALALLRGKPFDGVEKGTYGWAWEELIVSDMEAAVTDVAHRLSAECLEAGEARLSEWAAGRGLLAVPAEEVLFADRMRAALRLSGRPGLDRAARDAKAALGDQFDSGPLAKVHAELCELATAGSG